MRLRISIALAAVCAACAGAAPPADAPDPAAIRRVAIEALQGGVPDLFFRDEDITAAGEAIIAFRRRFPDLADIGPYPMTPLTLFLTDSAWSQLLATHPDPAGDSLLVTTGLRGVDSLNAALGARGVRIGYRVVGQDVAVLFARPANTHPLSGVYDRLPEVRFAGPPLMMGGGSDLTVLPRGDSVEIHATRGWGDCPSGCIYYRRWTFRYDRRTGRIVQRSDSGDPTPAAGFDTWRRRPDWAAFDRMAADARAAYADRLVEDETTPLRLLRALAPRLGNLPAFNGARALLARDDVRRDRRIVAALAALPSDDGRPARRVLFDEHGLALARDGRAPAFALAALLEEYTHRDPPPADITRLLLRNPRILGDPELLRHLIHEMQPLQELMEEACREYVARGYPVWVQGNAPEGMARPWYSRVPACRRPPPPEQTAGGAGFPE